MFLCLVLLTRGIVTKQLHSNVKKKLDLNFAFIPNEQPEATVARGKLREETAKATRLKRESVLVCMMTDSEVINQSLL